MTGQGVPAHGTGRLQHRRAGPRHPGDQRLFAVRAAEPNHVMGCPVNEPAGRGGDYVWRAIANDSLNGAALDTSPYWSDWRDFIVDSTATAGSNCAVQVLSDATDEKVQAALSAMVDQNPSVYGGVSSDETNAVYLMAKRVSGQSDSTTIANATSAAVSALYGALFPEELSPSQNALHVSVVSYSQQDLQAVIDDINARDNNNDPLLANLSSWGIDPASDSVRIGFDGLTSQLAQDVQTRYGTKAVAVEEAIAQDASSRYDDTARPRRGGMAIVNPEKIGGWGYCTAGVTVHSLAADYMLTDGHCSSRDNDHIYSSTQTTSTQDGAPINFLGLSKDRIWGNHQIDTGLVDTSASGRGEYGPSIWTGDSTTPYRYVGMGATE